MNCSGQTEISRLPGSRAKRREWIIFGLLLLACLAYRTIGIGQRPAPFVSTNDEFHYVWVGQTLLETGRPESWSFLKAYRSDRGEVVGYGEFRGGVVRLVRPALDHPPLFSVLAGVYAKVVGAFLNPLKLGAPPGDDAQDWRPPEVPPHTRDFRLGRVRTLALLLFALSFLLTFLLGRRLIGFYPTLAGLLLYGLMPYPVLHGRLLVTEALYAPLFLAGLLAVDCYLSGKWPRAIFALTIVATTAAAVLCKLVALANAVSIAVLFLLLASGPRRRTLVDAFVWPGLGCCLGLLTYLVYGYVQDWETLTAVLHHHAGRFRGFDLWPQAVINPLLVNDPGADRLYLIGWAAAGAFGAAGWVGARSSREKNVEQSALTGLTPSAFFIVPFIHLATHAYFVSTREFCGWHVLPYYPLVYLALGLAIWLLVRDARYPAWIVAVGLLAPRAGQVLHDFFRPPPIGKTEWWNGGNMRPAYLVFVALALVLPSIGPRMRVWTVRAGTGLFLAVELAHSVQLVHF